MTNLASHNSPIVGNPTRLSGRAMSSNYTPVSPGNVADIVTTLVGAPIVKPFSIPEADWHYTGTLAVTTQTAIKTAAGAGFKNYLTGFEIVNNAATANSIQIKDGSTVIWQGTLAAALGDKLIITFPSPLKTSNNAALNIQLSAATSVYLNLHGYVAP